MLNLPSQKADIKAAPVVVEPSVNESQARLPQMDPPSEEESNGTILAKTKTWVLKTGLTIFHGMEFVGEVVAGVLGIDEVFVCPYYLIFLSRLKFIGEVPGYI